ncbi:hypothetical protein PVT67_07660 [Gallaecimonas kandeliae]|uniref:hypothetical protein n=1 Tax=Gallaecimonas kandeliae TaxID=3029055 RepID=UPI00264919E1|nr:hypothetical protein [Gallaecimonas kandeliae]WKE67101.1 hypothetical protein PVT67_07660 [Gallaecimonas kandeliae]
MRHNWPLLLTLTLSGCSAGAGFHQYIISKPSASSFESIGHFQHCFYDELDLGQCGFMSVASSGKLALIQDAPTGNLYFVYAESNEKLWVTDTFIGLVESALWNENDGIIRVKGNGFEKSFNIPQSS